MADLLSLADRVEKAEAGSRELDAAIGQATVCEGWRVDDDGAAFCWVDGPEFGEGWMPNGEAPAYTSSLDAAMTLVPEGVPIESLSWWPSVPEGYESERCCRVTIRSLDANGFAGRKQFKSEAATPALALCAAALRARANNGSAT